MGTRREKQHQGYVDVHESYIYSNIKDINFFLIG